MAKFFRKYGGLLGAAAGIGLGIAFGGPLGAAAAGGMGFGSTASILGAGLLGSQLGSSLLGGGQKMATAANIKAPTPILADNAQAQEAMKRERDKNRRAMGRSSTILNSGTENNSPALQAKSLIGGA